MTNFDLNFIKKSQDGIILTIKLTPNASKDEITGYTEEYIKVRISAPPNKNKANKKLISFLSDWLGTAKSNIALTGGDKSRLKKILIKNIKPEDLVQKICIYDKIST